MNVKRIMHEVETDHDTYERHTVLWCDEITAIVWRKQTGRIVEDELGYGHWVSEMVFGDERDRLEAAFADLTLTPMEA